MINFVNVCKNREFVYIYEYVKPHFDTIKSYKMCRKRFKSRALKKSHSLKKELGFFSCGHYNRSMGKEDSEMLKDHSQLKRSLSPYQEIYDAIIPANYLLRKIKENVDFKP